MSGCRDQVRKAQNMKDSCAPRPGGPVVRGIWGQCTVLHHNEMLNIRSQYTIASLTSRRRCELGTRSHARSRTYTQTLKHSPLDNPYPPAYAATKPHTLRRVNNIHTHAQKITHTHTHTHTHIVRTMSNLMAGAHATTHRSSTIPRQRSAMTLESGGCVSV